MLALHFKVKFDKLFVQRVLRSRLTSYLQIESSEANLLRLEKNLSQGFEVIDIFFKKCGFKHMLISQTFLYLQENK